MLLVFLLEEESMKALLDILLPKFLPEFVTFQCIPHEGKQDLEKSIPRKLNAWKTPDTYFVIVRDKDNANCIDIKQRLVALCVDAGRSDSLVRIASQELEKLIKGYRKVSGAKKIAPYLAIESNCSPSFLCFISGVKSLIASRLPHDYSIRMDINKTNNLPSSKRNADR
jgi:hypothetical protein